VLNFYLFLMLIHWEVNFLIPNYVNPFGSELFLFLILIRLELLTTSHAVVGIIWDLLIFYVNCARKIKERNCQS